MISNQEKRAALGLTQQDIDTAARRTAVALTREPTGQYVQHIAERLAESMACAVFEAELPEDHEWRPGAMEDFLMDQGESWAENAEERGDEAA